MKDSFKSADALNEYYKLVENSIRMQKEAEANKILNDNIVYFDNQPFFRESDLVKNDENEEKSAEKEGQLELF